MRIEIVIRYYCTCTDSFCMLLVDVSCMSSGIVKPIRYQEYGSWYIRYEANDMLCMCIFME